MHHLEFSQLYHLREWPEPVATAYVAMATQVNEVARQLSHQDGQSSSRALSAGDKTLLTVRAFALIMDGIRVLD